MKVTKQETNLFISRDLFDNAGKCTTKSAVFVAFMYVCVCVTSTKSYVLLDIFVAKKSFYQIRRVFIHLFYTGRII